MVYSYVVRRRSNNQIVFRGRSSSAKRWQHLKNSCFTSGYTKYNEEWNKEVRGLGLTVNTIDQYYIFEVILNYVDR